MSRPIPTVAAGILTAAAFVAVVAGCKGDDSDYNECLHDAQNSGRIATCTEAPPPYGGFYGNTYGSGSYGNPGVRPGSGGAYSPGSAPVGPAG